MKLIFKTYEPNKGYEEQQAQLYSTITGRTVSADDIKKRYRVENIDFLTVRYVFNSEGTLIGYCQARDYEGMHETHIGYPWTTSECPKEAKHQLFDELYAYLKTRTDGYPIKMNATNSPENIKFTQSKGFKAGTKYFYYYFLMESVDSWNLEEISNRYEVRKAIEGNIPQISKLYIKLREPFGNSEDSELRSYMKQRVHESFFNVVFFNNTLVGFSAPILPVTPASEDPEGVLMYGFTLLHPDHNEAVLLLLRQAAMDNNEENWQKKQIRIGSSDLHENLHEFLLQKCTKHEIVAMKMIEG